MGGADGLLLVLGGHLYRLTDVGQLLAVDQMVVRWTVNFCRETDTIPNYKRKCPSKREKKENRGKPAGVIPEGPSIISSFLMESASLAYVSWFVPSGYGEDACGGQE